jgi:hypothetical protein
MLRVGPTRYLGIDHSRILVPRSRILSKYFLYETVAVACTAREVLRLSLIRQHHLGGGPHGNPYTNTSAYLIAHYDDLLDEMVAEGLLVTY